LVAGALIEEGKESDGLGEVRLFGYERIDFTQQVAVVAGLTDRLRERLQILELRPAPDALAQRIELRCSLLVTALVDELFDGEYLLA